MVASLVRGFAASESLKGFVEDESDMVSLKVT